MNRAKGPNVLHVLVAEVERSRAAVDAATAANGPDAARDRDVYAQVIAANEGFDGYVNRIVAGLRRAELDAIQDLSLIHI